MVEVGYGRDRVGSELSQLGSTWFVGLTRLLLVHGVCLNSPK